jgi:hypothetical protein
MSSLARRLDSFPELWRHEKGDKLIGVVIDVALRYTGGHKYVIVSVGIEQGGSTENGGCAIAVGSERAFHASADVVGTIPSIGDVFAVGFHGMVDDTAVGMYRVITEKTIVGWNDVRAIPIPDDVPF